MPLEPPPLDANGKVIPHDHHQILAGDRLIRRISTQHIMGPEGAKRVSSMAFQCSSDGTGMSVDISKLIVEAGLDVAAFVTAPLWPCSVFFQAEALRAEGLQVGYYPVPDNPYHGSAWGNVNKGKRNRLLHLAEWFVKASDVALGDHAA